MSQLLTTEAANGMFLKLSEQTLTAAQKLQARTNIGAMGVDDSPQTAETPEALENNTVSINSNGIFTEAKPSTRGGVMDGLIMMLSMNVDIDDAAVGLTGTHECWLDKNYFGESASLSCTYGIDESSSSIAVIVTVNGNDLPSRPIISSSLYGGTVSGFTMPVCTTILEDNRIKITFLSIGADIMLFDPDYYFNNN